MSQAQAPKYKIVAPCGNENEFASEEKAKREADSHEGLCPECDVGDVEIHPLDESADAKTDGNGEQSSGEDVDAESVDHVGTNGAESEVEPHPDRELPTNAEMEQAHAQTLAQVDDLPEVNPVEEKARSIIQSLDHADMTRLVWDPAVDPATVPYDPSRLPYDRPEPSAEAFDMFATIIEGELDVRYSVVDVSFTEAENTLGCTVEIEKQTPDGAKRLVGVKTRTNTNKDHWRERLYSKARRNALKQDIPPTWVSTLLRRYKQMEG